MKPGLAAVAAAICAGCFAHGGGPPGGHEGVTIVLQEGNRPPRVVYLQREQMRTDGEGREGSAVIVDARDRRILRIDEAERTYEELDEKVLQTVRDFNRRTRDNENTALERQLSDLPPAERQAAAALRTERGLASDGSAPELRFERTGETRTVSGIACEMYRALRAGVVWEEDCISPWEAGLFPGEDLARMAKFLRESLGPQPGAETDLFRLLDAYPGFPVSRSLLFGEMLFASNSAPTEVVKSIKRGAIPEEKFGPPAGFTKKVLAPAPLEASRPPE